MPRTRYFATAAGALAAAAIAVASAVAPAPASAAPDRPGPRGARCSAMTVPVELATGARANAGAELCLPGSGANGTVEVLVSGATYDAHYWTLPPVPGQKSYVADQLSRGFATLTVDRLGTGGSDRPPAAEVTYEQDVQTVHAAVSRLRAGARGASFSKIFLVGHSFGAGAALGEAARYGDVTGVVLSGFAHATGPKGGEIVPSLVPAASDPVTAPGNPPEGYLTTLAGRRGYLFHDDGDADPRTVEADERTKSTLTTGERDTLAVPYDAALGASLKVPALVAVGGKDALTCGGPYLACSSGDEVAAFEKLILTGTPRLDGYVLPDAGHAMNLARNASEWYAAAAAWMDSVNG